MMALDDVLLDATDNLRASARASRQPIDVDTMIRDEVRSRLQWSARRYAHMDVIESCHMAYAAMLNGDIAFDLDGNEPITESIASGSVSPLVRAIVKAAVAFVLDARGEA